MDLKIAVILPSYRVRDHILHVIDSIGPECSRIFVVDDNCPDKSGAYVETEVDDPRVTVIYHEENKGVGGAVVTGYLAALAEGFDVAVKVDGDGQMDPRLIPRFVSPLARGEADYTKGNRFFSFYYVRKMPAVRLFGNAILSFMSKLSSGYWHAFDPTNGFTAIHSSALRRLDLANLSERYFFESDMLIQLGDIRAVVQDIPMEALYGEETSNLSIKNVLGPFLFRHIRATVRRVVYSYFLRDFSVASANLLVGSVLALFGGFFGAFAWRESLTSGVPATTGTVMISVLPILMGFQLILFFIGYDTTAAPSKPLQRLDAPSVGDKAGHVG